MAVKSCNTWCSLALVLIVAHLSLSYGHPQPEADNTTQKVRVRRQFYVCPPGFKRISSNCYYFSQHMATWQDAHYDCRDRHSDLAILQTPAEDKKLRGQLNKPTVTPLEWWIGGIYDWEQMQWKWGASGKQLEYHGFSRMGPENKEKLKWHCIILDPTMKYKWSARSCVLGKHYVCQKKVARVNRRGLEKLRKKYNSTLNEIPAPIYQKPIKPRKHHENLSNGHAKTGLKHHRLNGINTHDNNTLNNAFGHRRNSTEIRKGRKRDRKNREGKGRKNRKNNQNNLQLYIRNGTEIGAASAEHGFPVDKSRKPKRNRRNKSKESKEANSAENLIISEEELHKKKKHLWNKENNNSMEDITQKTSYLANTISPLHPRIIVEEHDFQNLNKNN